MQSPGQISSTARAFASVSGDVFAKTLCSRRFVATTASSRVERRSRARESKGKKRRDPAHSTSEEEEGGVCARIVPWTSVETNVRGSLLKRGKTHSSSGTLSCRAPPDFIFATVTTDTRGSS